MNYETYKALIGTARGLIIGSIVGLLFCIGWVGYGELTKKKVVYVPLGTKTITCFHAVKAECDSTPDIGAGGRVAINGNPTGKWCASNELPFGTKIVIPSVSGNTVWTVRDRLNAKHPHRVDLLISLGAVGIGKRSAQVFIVAEVK